MNARKLFLLGYDELVSVVPPNAPLADGSKITLESRGKAPGIRYRSGFWGGYAWRAGPTSYEETTAMDDSGANIGLRAGKFPAVDIDVNDTALVEQISSVIESETGAVRYRVGLYPKRLYPFRLEGEPFQRIRLEIEKDGRRHLVEILGEGQQYVILGTHPSGKEYSWPEGFPLPDELPVISREKAEELLKKIAGGIPGATAKLSSAKEAVVVSDQSSLLAPSIERLVEVVRSIPNSLTSHPSRADYIAMAVAVKAAGAQWPKESWKLWLEWALKWPGRDGKCNTEAGCRKDWNSLHPPFRIGWSWLLDTAARFGVQTAQLEFDPVDSAPPPRPASKAIETTPSRVMYSDVWVRDKIVSFVQDSYRRVVDSGEWLRWNGWCWEPFSENEAFAIVSRIITEVSNEIVANTPFDEKIPSLAKHLVSARSVENLFKFVCRDPRIQVREFELNSRQDILGTPDGVYNLMTGERMSPDKSHLVTNVTAVSPKPVEAILWKRFLHDMTGGNQELIDYLQIVCGYWLTGHTNEQAIWFLWGPGGNGKSVFFSTIMSIMGPYARKVPIDIFLQKRWGHSPTELTSLLGARLVVAAEAGEGSVWDEGRLKEISGGEPITVRRLYHEAFEFRPMCKILLVANAQPELKRVDEGIRRRLKFIPATFKPVEVNKHLGEQLLNEAGEILHWMIQGAMKWYRVGLPSPEVVEASTEEYLEDNDPFTVWIQEACETGPKCRATFSDLYDNWVSWCATNDVSPGSKKRFAARLRNCGFHRQKKATGATEYKGISVKAKKGDEFIDA